MSIFRPFFYFLVLRWPICRYFSFELSHDTSKRLNSRLGTKSRSKKKKKFRILFPQNHFIFLPKVSHLVLRHLPYGTPRKHSWSSAASSWPFFACLAKFRAANENSLRAAQSCFSGARTRITQSKACWEISRTERTGPSRPLFNRKKLQVWDH